MKRTTSILLVTGLALGALVLFIGQGWAWLGLGGVLPVQTLLLCLIWSALTGLTYASAPEAGGFLVAFGHMTLFAWAIAMAIPVLGNIPLVDSIRLCNAVLGCAAGAAVLVREFSRGGVAKPMVIWAGIGAALGSAAASFGTLGLVTPKVLHLLFGAYLIGLTAIMGARYTLRGQRRVERDLEAGRTLDEVGGPVEILSATFRKTTFAYGGVEFAFRPLTLLALGLATGFAAPLLGVGGFVLLPIYAKATRMPTRLVLPAAAKAVATACFVQALVFWTAGVALPAALIGAELIGLLAACLAGLYFPRIVAGLNPHRIFLAPAVYFAVRALGLALFGFHLWP